MAGSWPSLFAVSEEAAPEVLPFLMDHVAFYKRAGGSHTQNGRDTMKKSASAGYFCTE